jgi:RraA family protein
MNPGFRVRLDFPRVPADLGARAKELAASTLADNQSRLGVSRGIWPVAPGLRLAGPAFTVRTAPADNLMVHKAVEAASPGDVLVIDTCGCESHAVFGELMALQARRRGIGGVVVDGFVRDVAAIRACGLPVFARGACPAGPYKNGPGEIGYPVACGGVAVQPGDLVVGDDDGVVFIAADAARRVVEQAAVQAEREARTVEAIAAGTWDRTWIDETLRSKGCEGV